MPFGPGRLRATMTLCAFVVALALQSVDAQKSGTTTGEWPAYGGDLANTKYSPLDRIGRDNFGRLTMAWRWRSADAFLSRSIAGGGEVWTSSRVLFDQLRERIRNGGATVSRPTWRTSRPHL